jgi:UDP-N-acetylglucosamine--N-acetylmuramyl-(pentapeptide) pyrophosphoryl-undecaprenol N-acetylglucosamine transferase
MTFVIAAAGTGGHVFPGLSVGEALVDRGVAKDQILYLGGGRLEATVYPEAGFPFHAVEMRGLQRSMTPRNATLPLVVRRARDQAVEAMRRHRARAVLGMGGYITIPAGLASRRLRVPFFVSEQNARAGLANRVASRWARRAFGAFPVTAGIPSAVWVGNPVRRAFWEFDREVSGTQALDEYGLAASVPVLGVVGGSLGAGALNRVATTIATEWTGPEIQVLHLTGARFLDDIAAIEPAPGVTWVRRGFETEMDRFYAASDLVLARAGGAVAELTATGTPSVLVPGEFGSGGHQSGNSRVLADAGAALVVTEDRIGDLPEVIAAALADREGLARMSKAAMAIAKPHAAHAVADALIEAAS